MPLKGLTDKLHDIEKKEYENRREKEKSTNGFIAASNQIHRLLVLRQYRKSHRIDQEFFTRISLMEHQVSFGRVAALQCAVRFATLKRTRETGIISYILFFGGSGALA